MTIYKICAFVNDVRLEKSEKVSSLEYRISGGQEGVA